MTNSIPLSEGRTAKVRFRHAHVYLGDGRLARWNNVPDEQLTEEQIEMRGKLRAAIDRIPEYVPLANNRTCNGLTECELEILSAEGTLLDTLHGIAYCADPDRFSREVGRRVALRRVLEQTDHTTARDLKLFFDAVRRERFERRHPERG